MSFHRKQNMSLLLKPINANKTLEFFGHPIKKSNLLEDIPRKTSIFLFVAQFHTHLMRRSCKLIQERNFRLQWLELVFIQQSFIRNSSSQSRWWGWVRLFHIAIYGMVKMMKRCLRKDY